MSVLKAVGKQQNSWRIYADMKSLASSGQNDPRKKYERKPTILTNYCFLIHFENLYTTWDCKSLLLPSMDVV